MRMTIDDVIENDDKMVKKKEKERNELKCLPLTFQGYNVFFFVFDGIRFISNVNFIKSMAFSILLKFLIVTNKINIIESNDKQRKYLFFLSKLHVFRKWP